jgi:hypothetical protein
MTPRQLYATSRKMAQITGFLVFTGMFLGNGCTRAYSRAAASDTLALVLLGTYPLHTSPAPKRSLAPKKFSQPGDSSVRERDRLRAGFTSTGFVRRSLRT